MQLHADTHNGTATGRACHDSSCAVQLMLHLVPSAAAFLMPADNQLLPTLTRICNKLPVLAGVDEVLAGSVIAICYIDFTKDCPTQAVDAAMEQLHTNGQSMFADSGLPAKYGWLLSYNMGQLKSDVVQDGPGDIPIQSMNFPPPTEKRPAARGNSKVSLTITIVIAVGVLVVIVGIVGAVLTMRHRRAKRRRQQQRPKKKVPPKIKEKIGGGGGTVSGYLADLDGMLDDEGDSDKIKSSAGQVRQAPLHVAYV